MTFTKRFDPHDPSTADEVKTAYEWYMQEGETLETTGLRHNVGHRTLKAVFYAYNLPLKINRTVNPDEVRELQRELDAPIDYLAARYAVHENTVRRWLKNSKYKHKKFQGMPAKRWWRAISASCGDDPNDFYAMMRAEPHGLSPAGIVRIYHRRFKPKGTILWMLDAPLPAEIIDAEDVPEYAASTEYDTSVHPQMFIGTAGVVNPIRWSNSIRELDGEYHEEESDADLASVAEELGMTLEEIAKQQR